MAAISRAHARVLVLWCRTADEDRVVGVSLDVLLQILRSLERLPAKVTLVRLERDMDTDVRSDVVSLDSGCAAASPLARQVEVVGALPAYMSLADVVVEDLGSSEALAARVPPTDKRVILRCGRCRPVGCRGGRGRRRRRIAIGV